MQRFYFDHNASTAIAKEVLTPYIQALCEVPGNASSIHHYGQMAKQQLEAARGHIAALLSASPKEIVLVSGGTEANNLAIAGAAADRHVVTTAIEHPSLLQACKAYADTFTAVPVGQSGVVAPEDIRQAIRPDTALISVMHVNNETGAIQAIEAIASLARENGILFHSDGVQAAGRIPVNLSQIPVDLYSTSSHKMYAPKGCGALFVRKGVNLKPLLYGGRHEQSRRAGTENVPGAVAFGAAAALAGGSLESEVGRLSNLRDRLESGILEKVPDVSVNGDAARRSPNTSSLCFHGIEGESLVIALDLQGFAVSSGSACSSGAVEPSHVLLAMGLSPLDARSCLRFSLGRPNNEAQVDALIEAVRLSAARLRKLSPGYVAHV